MGGHRIGYKRVSTVDQNTGRQLEGLQLGKVFEDKASGKDTKRPKLEECLQYLREGDTLVVHSIDRLARNLGDLEKIVASLNEKGVSVQFVKEGLTFGVGDESPMARLQLQMMGAFAQFERALIRERQKEGIAAAKKGGKHLGRKATLTTAQVEEIKARVAAGESKTTLAKEYGVSRPTLYAALGQGQQPNPGKSMKYVLYLRGDQGEGDLQRQKEQVATYLSKVGKHELVGGNPIDKIGNIQGLEIALHKSHNHGALLLVPRVERITSDLEKVADKREYVIAD